MRGSRRAARSAPRGRKRRGLWSLISRLFGTPKGRHVAGAPQPPRPIAIEPGPRVAAEAPETPPSESSGAEAAPIGESEIADFTPASASVATAVQASVPAATTPAGLASVRLIFTDGSVVPLPAGSVEERQAEYLARRVLEAGGRG
ncbi:MAG: hypothetical protein GEU68_04175 [Actinobacteria bacterium]|nr:hypothetical protein [Actinomycetota bacterium]